MKLSNIASTVIATLALVAGAANAADPAAPVSVNGGTVHFKGELVNAACSVNTDSSE
ncbi:type 1 fimbrial protein subunit FimA, partial [Klebsiella pneumoniae]|nr:type 1 fimbrial protein subunit FimA [Klebsiella pneumoniae]